MERQPTPRKLSHLEKQSDNPLLTVAFDMTFPSRIRGGSRVYAHALLARLRAMPDLAVRPISGRRQGGVATTLRWLMRDAARATRRSGAGLLHCPAFVAPWRTSVPLVITMHDAAALRFPSEFAQEWRIYNRYFLPVVARRAAAVLVGTESSRSDLVRYYGLDARRVVVTRYGVDDIYRRPADPARIAQEREALLAGHEGSLLLFSGAPLPRKNLDTVLHAMSGAGEATLLSRSTLVITGATEQEYPKYRDMVVAHRLGSRVVWLGQLPLERLATVYAAADLLVYPSFYEGFGLPPLEAMASGTPVVASQANCLPEVLGDAALLVDPADRNGLRDALESVLTDDALRGSLVAKGRDRASLFTWERCAQETIAVYRRVISARRSAT